MTGKVESHFFRPLLCCDLKTARSTLFKRCFQGPFCHRGQAELLERQELVGNPPEHQADVAALLEIATRNRAISPNANPKSHPPTSWSSC